jgi:hypothetical protein
VPRAPDFRAPETQQRILLEGSREEIIEWLAWNDPSGVWTDSDSAAEGWTPMTLEQARGAMRNALAALADERPVPCQDSISFDPHLPDDADEETCKEWLRKLCWDFGMGFHPDTPADDYIDDQRRPLPPDLIDALDDSMDRAFELLGDVVYEVCAKVGELQLAQFLGIPRLDYGDEGPEAGQTEEDQ